MNIKKVNITQNIVLLIFEDQKSITSTFIRFQEYYESPKFKNKIFSLDDYKKWYIKQKGSFSYYTDWNGFNIPSHILKPFKKGLFNPLSQKEKHLLNMFKDRNDDFYIIGIHKEKDTSKDVLKHEIAHGLYYTDQKYQDKIKKILQEFNTKPVKEELQESYGYHEDVLNDEVHAYLIASSKTFKQEIPKKLQTILRDIYQETLIRHDVDINEYDQLL